MSRGEDIVKRAQQYASQYRAALPYRQTAEDSWLAGYGEAFSHVHTELERLHRQVAPTLTHMQICSELRKFLRVATCARCGDFRHHVSDCQLGDL